jgi:hypothetical protein
MSVAHVCDQVWTRAAGREKYSSGTARHGVWLRQLLETPQLALRLRMEKNLVNFINVLAADKFGSRWKRPVN